MGVLRSSTRGGVEQQPLFPDVEPRLLDELFEHQLRRDFVYHHTWRKGDLMMWDNRCTLHWACGGIVPPGIRHMHRTTIQGDPSE
ncbi:MAG: TauD/TfdA family dioxygenase [Proteobacteria bacterium]|nr:TauD/TfdA family dioxygenase [Pseudomonadota bacterium]